MEQSINSFQWFQLSVMEPKVITYAKSSYVTTKRQNKVSKESVLCGSDNIGVLGKTIIESQAVIRGDLSTIELGMYCVVGRGAVIRPPEQRFQGRLAYIPMTIGDHVLIEENCVIEAAQIGACCHIANDCIVGARCMLSSCTALLPHSVLAPGTVTPPFSIWSGSPARIVGKLPDCFAALWTEHTKTFYRSCVAATAAKTRSVVVPSTPNATTPMTSPVAAATPSHSSFSSASSFSSSSSASSLSTATSASTISAASSVTPLSPPPPLPPRTARNSATPTQQHVVDETTEEMPLPPLPSTPNEQ